MGVVTLTDPVTLTTVASGLVSTNNANLRAVINGGIDNSNIAAAAGILGSKVQFSTGTTPPVSPSDGDLWLYASGSTYWLFKYVAAEATYKWVSIGGEHAKTGLVGAGWRTVGSTWGLTTGGVQEPRLTIPRSGDYHIEYGGQFQKQGAGTVNTQSLEIAPVLVSAPTGAIGGQLTWSDADTPVANNRVLDFVGQADATLVAGNVLALGQYQTIGITSGFNVTNRFLRIKPYRVI